MFSITSSQLRLIRKYTNNLTIIYDGDAAGIKAALRGLDMALEEGLNVKVVLIPDNENPDSYVNKVGTNAFIDFIASTKKDFVLFQLEVMLKEAGNDISKKNDVVNSIAESLSKISKAEDFSKQQEYIRQASALLKIDESGLTNLVNKYKRDRFAKDEKKLPFEESINETVAAPEPEFINADEPYEKNVLRVLLEYGLKPWNEKQSIAEHIFEELEQFNFELPDMERLFEEYRQQYLAGYEPTAKSLLYHDDKQFRELVISVTMFPYELSQRWDDVMENMNILNRDVSHQDVSLSLNYFKMRKIKKMLDLNQQDLQDDSKTFEQKKELIQIHLHLKEIEKELRSELGTVIFK